MRSLASVVAGTALRAVRRSRRAARELPPTAALSLGAAPAAGKAGAVVARAAAVVAARAASAEHHDTSAKEREARRGGPAGAPRRPFSGFTLHSHMSVDFL